MAIKKTQMLQRLALFIMCIGVCACLVAEHCRAEPSRLLPTLELGSTYLDHYDFKYTPLIQPVPSFHAHALLGFWMGKQVMFYALFMKGLAARESQGFGGGFKMMFASFGGSRSGLFPGTFNLCLAGDLLRYVPRKPVLPERYVDNQVVIRLGGAIYIPLSQRIYIDISGYLLKYSGAVMGMGSLGVGMNFGKSDKYQ